MIAFWSFYRIGPLRSEIQLLLRKSATELLLSSEIQLLLRKSATELLLSSEIHVLQPILSHTLLQKRLTLVAGLRTQKFLCMNLLDVPRNAHHIQISPLQLTDITQLLHDVLLGMNAVRRVSRPHTPCPIPVRGCRQNLTPQDDNRHVNAVPLLIALGEIGRPRIRQELLEDGSLGPMERRHFFTGWLSWIRCPRFQFYPQTL
jgi:hypothetical protein